MRKILVVSQKDIMKNPVFRQDKQLKEILTILSDDKCDVSLMYLNKEFKSESESSEDSSDFKIKKIYLRDMIKRDLLTKNLTDLVLKEKFETIIFTSYNMAQFVLPRIKDICGDINIIVDFRLSQLDYILQKHKLEIGKKYQNLYFFSKSFKIHFFQAISVLRISDANIFSEDIELDLLNKENVENIIKVSEITQSFPKRIQKNKFSVENICINGDNFAAGAPLAKSIKKNGINCVNFSKNSNLIDEINDIISKTKSQFIFIYNSKLKIFPKTADELSKYLSFNDNIGIVSPVTSYAQGTTNKKLEVAFEEQSNNNFANSEETHPAFFSECFMVNKNFFKKFGYFDRRFKTIDYALFDFIMRLYQNKVYFFTVKDIAVFKAISVKQPVSLFKKDIEILHSKWGECKFDFSLE